LKDKNGEHPFGDSGQLILLAIFLLIWVVVFIFYNHIAGYEEKLLEDRFDEAYQNYKKRTGKWVPMIGRPG